MLTPSHFELLSFIEAYADEHGFSPSYNEMAKAVGLRSRSGVHRLVNCLVDRGYVRRLPSKARAIEVIRRPGQATPEHDAEAILRHVRDWQTGCISATEALSRIKVGLDAIHLRRQITSADLGQRPEVL